MAASDYVPIFFKNRLHLRGASTDGYFPSQEALIAEAVGQALPPAPDEAKPRSAAAEFADGYLSVRHRDNRPTSCLFSSLGTSHFVDPQNAERTERQAALQAVR